MDIKEIALKVADSLRNKIDGISHMQSNQGLVVFAEALVAELAKQNKPVAIIEKEAGFETEVYATGHADSLPDGVFKLYAAPVPITTPDVCGEVCVRAKLCYGCGKALDEANAKFTEQAEQKPVAWRVRGYNQFKTGNPAPWRYVDGADKPTVNKPDCCDFEPLYAAPVRTKDLTDDEIEWLVVDTLETWNSKDTMKDFARAVLAAYKEKKTV